MDENGNEAKREKSGKCCCAISTIVIIIVLGLGVVAFVYREEIVKEYTKFSKFKVQFCLSWLMSQVSGIVEVMFINHSKYYGEISD